MHVRLTCRATGSNRPEREWRDRRAAPHPFTPSLSSQLSSQLLRSLLAPKRERRDRRRAPRAQRRSLSESDVCGRKREQQLPAHAAALGGGPTPRRRDAYLEPLDGETLTQSLSPTSCTLTKRATRVRAKCLHLPHWATTHVPVTPVTPVTCAFLIRGGPRRPAGGAGRFRSPTHLPLSEQPHITHILHHIPRIMCACMQLAVAYWATVGTD